MLCQSILVSPSAAKRSAHSGSYSFELQSRNHNLLVLALVSKNLLVFRNLIINALSYSPFHDEWRRCCSSLKHFLVVT